ncbi:MAG: ribulose-phosphate 3-epimerase [Synoicihabitans sp.]
MKHAPLLAPSLLAGDHAALGDSAAIVPATGLKWLHLDIMDGHFVPNLTFGPQIVAALRQRQELKDTFFDTHLMLAEPHRYVEAFAKAGSDLISIHIEPEYDHRATLARIRDLGCQNGIVLNPDTPAEAVKELLPSVDLVLVMTVQPGFGGQSFREDTLPKMATLDRWRTENSYDFRLEVDGGVDLTTGPKCGSQGVDTFVAGTAFFKAEDRAAFAAAVSSW